MRFRKLRIAWSIVWALLAILLVAWWVRSYWWIDGFGIRAGAKQADCVSVQGSVMTELFSCEDSGEQMNWFFETDYERRPTTFGEPTTYGFYVTLSKTRWQ